jgi:hypothetical protein
MQFFRPLKTSLLVVAVIAVLSQAVPGQQPESKEPQASSIKGIPPRSTPGDYQAHIEAGGITLAGEFTGHSVPTPDGVYESEDYVVVEVGLFGPPETRKKLAHEDFSMRINGKKAPLPAQPFELVMKSLKDPLWAPPESPAKSKSSLSTGGTPDNSPPPVVHMPFDLKRTMELRVQKAALPEGERALPGAGLLFFQYRGKDKSINSVELIYAGVPGNAVLRFQQ